MHKSRKGKIGKNSIMGIEIIDLLASTVTATAISMRSRINTMAQKYSNEAAALKYPKPFNTWMRVGSAVVDVASEAAIVKHV